MKYNNELINFFFNCKGKGANIFSGIITLIFCIFLFIRLSPFIYYIYTLIPYYILWRILININYLKSFFIKDNGSQSILKNNVIFILTIGLFLLMVSIKINIINIFTYRALFSVKEKFFVFFFYFLYFLFINYFSIFDHSSKRFYYIYVSI